MTKYDEFPKHFHHLKAALDNEDYERAEKILVDLLKRKPTHQQAKYDLERVQGRMGSIDNYAFRVNAFLDQGDLRQAEALMREALAKFKKNGKIASLRKQIAERLAKRKQGAAAQSAAAASGANDDLPNLQTFVVNDRPGANPINLPGMDGAGGADKPWLKPGSGGGKPWKR